MRVSIKIIFSITIVAFAHVTYGQKQLSITPALGGSLPFSYSITPPINEKGYRANALDDLASLNINFQYNLNNHWLFFAGWQVSDNTGVGIKYGQPKNDLFKGRFTTSIGTHRFPIGIGRNIVTCKWFKLERRVKILMRLKNDMLNDDILYLVLFRLNIIGGFSFNHVNGKQDSGNFSHGAYSYTVTNSNNIAFFTGLNLQFFNYSRDHIQLSIIYSRGLQKVGEYNFTYNLRSGDYASKVGTRGSNLTVQVGYPIRLITFNKKS